MIRHTYTYTRPDILTKWWDGPENTNDNAEVATLANHQIDFFNNNVDTNSGEKWSLIQIDDLTKVFTLELSPQRLTEIEALFELDNDLTKLRELSDDYNDRFGITKQINNVDI